MINLGYFFNFGSCGYYCLKHIIGKFKCDNKKYMSLYEVSEILKKNNYACISVRLSSVDDILFDCITLVRVNKLSYHYIVLKKIKNKASALPILFTYTLSPAESFLFSAIALFKST